MLRGVERVDGAAPGRRAAPAWWCEDAERLGAAAVLEARREGDVAVFGESGDDAADIVAEAADLVDRDHGGEETGAAGRARAARMGTSPPAGKVVAS